MKNKSKNKIVFLYIPFFVISVNLFFGLLKHNFKPIHSFIISFGFFTFFSVLSRILFQKFGNVEIPQRKAEIFFVIFVVLMFSAIIFGILSVDVSFNFFD